MNSRRLICLPRLRAVYKHSERYHIEPWPYLNWITLITADAIAFGGALRTASVNLGHGVGLLAAPVAGHLYLR